MSASITASSPSGSRGPTIVLLLSASLWGLTWWPLKRFGEAGLSGPALSLLTYGVVGLFGLVLLLRQRPAWRSQTGLLILLALVGGWANTAFVNALMLGDVVRTMFLFYLSPVWSVLGGWLILGETVRPRRAAAVGLALLGLWFVIGGTRVLDSAPSTSDMLALSAGLAFAGNNIIARAGQQIPMLSKTASVFVGCGVLSAATVWLMDLPLPGAAALASPLGLGLLVYGFGWLVLVTATWQYGVTHLEAGRAGVVLMVELLVAVLSATLLGDERLAPAEWLGGALIAAGALLEATDGGEARARVDPLEKTA